MQRPTIFAHWPNGQRLTTNGRGGVTFTKDGAETILDRIDEYAAPAYEELDRYTSAEIEEMNREEMDREVAREPLPAFIGTCVSCDDLHQILKGGC